MSKDVTFEQEAKELEIGDVPESDLSLSPLILPSHLISETLLNNIDLFGSNADLIDPATFTNL